MKLISFFMLIVLLFVSDQTFANWSDQAREIEAKYDHHPVNNPYVSSVFGLFRRPNYYYRREVRPSSLWQRRVDFKFSSEVFKFQKFSVFIRSPRDSRGRVKARPIAIFNPGIFSGFGKGFTEKITQRFLTMGFTVVSFANPFSEDYINFGPRFELGDFDYTAKLHNEISRKVLRFLEKKGLAKRPYILSGISFGGFLSTVMYSQKEYKNVFDDLVVFSPPLKFLESVAQVDNMASLASRFNFEFRIPAMVIGIMNIKNKNPYALNNSRFNLYGKTLEMISTFSFQRSLKKSTERMHRVLSLGPAPQGLNFHQSFKRYSQKYLRSLSRNPSKTHLSYYLNKISDLQQDYKEEEGESPIRHKNKINSVKILLSRDDFIIDSGVDQLLNQYSEQSLVLDDGGHLGYVPLFWFDKLLYQDVTMYSNRPRHYSAWKDVDGGDLSEHESPLLRDASVDDEVENRLEDFWY